MPVPDYPVLLFPDADAWGAWLRENHASAPGVWMRVAKLASPLQSVTMPEALDLALCYGWIDGQRRGLDADCYLQKFTPRRRRSVWSKRNCEHVERLIRSGAMQAAGLAEVEAAKRDGRWQRAYDAAGSAEMPADLQAALDADPPAKAFFEGLKSQNRFAILYRVQTAVRPETRARRIAQLVDMLHRGETIRP